MVVKGCELHRWSGQPGWFSRRERARAGAGRRLGRQCIVGRGLSLKNIGILLSCWSC